MYKKITKIVSINLKKLWTLLKRVIKITKIITRIITKLIATIIAALLLIFFINTFLSADKVAKENDRLLAEFKTIQHPVNTIELNPREKISRGPLYSAEFQYTLSDEEIENYYDQELKKIGWIKEGKRKENDYKGFSYTKDQNVISFFKNKNNIKIKGAWKVNLYYHVNVK